MERLKIAKRIKTALLVLIIAVVVINVGLMQSYGTSSIPAKPKISYLRSKAINTFTVKCKKDPKVTGHQIEYSLNKDFKNSKTVMVKGKSLNRKVSGLKGGKRYYVRIRAYKIVNGKKIYSDWSPWRAVPVIKSENSAVRYMTKVTTNVYRRPDSNSSKIRLWYGTKVKLISSRASSSNGKWYKISYRGRFYYLWDKAESPEKITGKIIVKTDDEYLAGCKTELQKKILTNAFDIYHNWNTAYDYGSVYTDGLEMEGNKYIFHCSGFAAYVYNSTIQKYAPPFKISNKAVNLANTGYVLNENLTGEIKGKEICSGTINRSRLRPGDIICFKMMSDNNNEIDHVALYIGNGQIIQSTRVIEGVYDNNGLDPDGGVCIAPLTGIYNNGFRKAIRILPDEIRSADLEMTVTANASHIMADRSCREVAEENALHNGDRVKILYTYRTSSGTHNAYIAYGDDYGKSGYLYKYEEKLN